MSSNPCKKWVMEANVRRCGLLPTSMSAASCKADVYACCQLLTMGTELSA